ncbi:MAG: hypothetical protein JWM48_1455 [Mycobacterium sp.]|jgi:DivIVA domain-containing protein|nr:hypothetical protein [Mycobacterium sp.]MCW2744905.1 hypothetical protein [Mycobacterium sp.]
MSETTHISPQALGPERRSGSEGEGVLGLMNHGGSGGGPSVEEGQPEFTVVLRGYDRNQVEDYLDSIAAFVSDAEHRARTADARVAAAQQRAEVAHERAQRLEAQLEKARESSGSYTGLGERIQRMLEMAEEESADLIATARAEVAELEERSEAERRRLQAEADRELRQVTQQRDSVVSELRRLRKVISDMTGGTLGEDPVEE